MGWSIHGRCVYRRNVTVVVVMSLMLRFAQRWPLNARLEDYEITSWYLSHRLHDHGADDWEATGQKPCDLQLLGWHEYCLDERKAFTCEAGVWDFFVIFFQKKKQLTFLNIKNLEVSLGRPGYTWIQSWRHPISTSQIWKERMCPYTLPGEYRKSKRIQTPDTTLLGITTNGSCTSHVIWSNAPSRAFQWSTPFMWRMASKLEMFWRRSWLKAGKSFLWSQLTWAFSVPEWSMAPRRRDKELISRINDEVSGTERSQPFFQHGILCWLNFWSFLWQELSLENPLEKESEVKRRIFWTTLSHCCSMRQKISNKKSPWEAKRH